MFVLKGIIWVVMISVITIFMLACGIIAIVKRRKRERRGAIISFTLFAAALASLVITVNLFLGKIRTKTESAQQAIQERIDQKKDAAADGLIEVIGAMWEDDRSYLLDTIGSNRQIELLQSGVSPEIEKNIPPGFYTYFGFRDWYRFPLVYPYSLKCIDTMEDAYLVNEIKVKDHRAGDRSFSAGFEGIDRIATDNKILLMSMNKGSSFALFRYSDGSSLSFETEKELFESAKKEGYSGEPRLMTIAEYNALF